MTKTIMLIHGAWLNSASWAGFKARYEARGYTVIAPDLRGHGHTTLPTGRDGRRGWGRGRRGFLAELRAHRAAGQHHDIAVGRLQDRVIRAEQADIVDPGYAARRVGVYAVSSCHATKKPWTFLRLGHRPGLHEPLARLRHARVCRAG